MNLKEVDFNGLSSFYASVLNAWQIFIVKRDQSEITHEWVLEEPFLFNPLLIGFSNWILATNRYKVHVILKSKGVCTSMVRAGICKICHLRLMDHDGFLQKIWP